MLEDLREVLMVVVQVVEGEGVTLEGIVLGSQHIGYQHSHRV